MQSAMYTMMQPTSSTANNINYQAAVMYRTVSNDFQPGEPFDYDMPLFFSPSGIDSLLKNFPEFHQNDIQIGCFGATTAQVGCT